ncbi:sulfotransferase [Spirulina sp. CS-785/01]|uniref:sulfotransferase family protein n=1 Tax=Spirulina sp. CS-785/01 TaxID=3021716 RepID=UPI00232C768D|nr:sulfotransferase [Spirulina sp. CS-785/01]MDB9315311.1 sulfotransferase [Spirulina sp. CS-785/01]
MTLPNFFIVGAPRCGTTALSSYIAEHPNICLSRPKEPHYLLQPPKDISFEEYVSQYIEQFFGHCNPQRHSAIGEASVTYLYDDEVLKRVLQVNPEGKLIAMVRNPLDLLRSYHFWMLYIMDEDVTDFQEAWQLQERRLQGDYLPELCRDRRLLQYRYVAQLGTRIQRLFELAGRDRCLVLVFDDFIANPPEMYQKICHFLGVSDDGRTYFPQRQHSRTYRSSTIQRLLLHPPDSLLKKVSKPPGKDKLSQWKRLAILKLHRALLFLNRRTQSAPPLSPEMKLLLQDTYTDDVKLLSELLGRDLTYWLKT